ncbi:hypothetical protein AeMF1_014235 [Aphanomyces euteiches]|nr:hypothetical protein AeMF1_014235 [Aphanomyces euteiches]
MNISVPNTKKPLADYENKMMEAQSLFRRVVKAELQLLLDQGIARDVAVKNLLQRIVKCATEPSESEVRKVMYQFQMNRDDAVRALIVKQELARLKQRGLDSFAAIEELTLKMQLLLPLSPTSHRDTDDEATKEDDVVKKEESGIAAPLSPTIATDVTDGRADASDAPSKETLPTPTATSKSKRKRKASGRQPNSSTSSASDEKKIPPSDESPEPSTSSGDHEDSATSKEVSLCEQITNCCISSSSPLDTSEPSTHVKKSSRKRRSSSDVDNNGDLPKASRYGAKKKLRLDVDQKIKAQLQENLVIMKTLPASKSSKRTRPKADANETYSSKKHRSE